MIARLYHKVPARIKGRLFWLLHPLAMQSRQRLRRLKNMGRGRRCFIIGNGPSLKHTDLTLLHNEVTFGLNRIYTAFPEIGFPTSFLVSVNRLVIEQCQADLERLNCCKLFNWSLRHHLRPDCQTIFLNCRYQRPRLAFYRDPTVGVHEGYTVTYVAMQLAFYMGFEKVFLVGVDHSFSSKGPPNKEVVSRGKDPDHFNPDYFGKGFRWQLPDLEQSEFFYRIADRIFRADGRRVYDATIGGKLDVFPKVDYHKLFHPERKRL